MERLNQAGSKVNRETSVRYESNIRKLRKAQGMSIRQLSILTKVNRGYLSWAERGQFNLTSEEIKRIASVLGEPIRQSVVSEYYPEEVPAE
jgi:transcriptional regulator with XRE-family HTH domain